MKMRIKLRVFPKSMKNCNNANIWIYTELLKKSLEDFIGILRFLQFLKKALVKTEPLIQHACMEADIRVLLDYSTKY